MVISEQMKRQKTSVVDVRHVLLRITRVHYFYIAAYAVVIILFDSWNLLTHEAVTQRWLAAALLLTVNTIIWYFCRLRLQNQLLYKTLFWVLIVSDILFASINVYWQRGMASKSVMLYAIPIICAGLARSRSLLFAVSSLSIAAYSLTAVKYFNDNYGQGYRIELYGEIAFYASLFFILSYLMMVSFRPSKD
jgi:hypothetical protein